MAVVGLMAVIGYGLWIAYRWETKIVASEVLSKLWDDAYVVPANAPTFGTCWPAGLTEDQHRVISDCSKVYVAILNDAYSPYSAPASRPQHFDYFHWARISRVVEVTDAMRFRNGFMQCLTPKKFEIDDHAGAIRYGIRFVKSAEDSSNAEVVDVVLAEAYSVAFIYSETDLRHVVCNRKLFELVRAILGDSEKPEFTYDLQ